VSGQPQRELRRRYGDARASTESAFEGNIRLPVEPDLHAQQAATAQAYDLNGAAPGIIPDVSTSANRYHVRNRLDIPINKCQSQFVDYRRKSAAARGVAATHIPQCMAV
jgi:hypothetical protein